MTTPDPPCHVIDHPGDRRARCGARDPLPVVVLEHLAAHLGHLEVCEACTEGLNMTPPAEAWGQLALEVEA